MLKYIKITARGISMEVKFIKTDKNATVPQYGTDGAAGADLYALIDEGSVTIGAGETYIVHTGIAMQIPEGYGGLILARSGIATKRGLAPANKVGLIDSDYRGEIMVPLHNHSNVPQEISSGERVAQIMITPFLRADFTECETLEDTARDKGGFGSTGTK